jgi:CTP:molybdopterin cytidylyltransferase MocA
MFESIRAGIDAARRLNPSATVVLQPGDHPRVAAATLKLLAECSLKRPVHSIIPQYRDLGGHPVLIPPKVAATLLNNDCPAGLGQFWLDNPGLCHRVAVDDPDVLRDIDTPADLAS